jgi:hypothetical protein
MGEEVPADAGDLLQRLLEVADSSGVGAVWISTIRMSRDLGMTSEAITDTILAIVHAGAQVPVELQALVDRITSPRA